MQKRLYTIDEQIQLHNIEEGRRLKRIIRKQKQKAKMLQAIVGLTLFFVSYYLLNVITIAIEKM